jgi:hypothetical protein
MDSQFSFRRKYRLTTRSLQRARSSLSTSFLVVLGLAAATASTYADDDHGRQGWDRSNDQHWVGTWGTSPEAGTTAFSNQTLRLVVHTSVAGDDVRIRISNAYGTTSLVKVSPAIEFCMTLLALMLWHGWTETYFPRPA